jgi:uncharacterized protein (DUF488 family)
MGRRRTTRAQAGLAPANPVLTVGHSSRRLDEFIGLLRAHGVTFVVDVRKMTRSRHNPQFNGDTLPASLHEAGIGYLDLPELGGLRRRRPGSPNGGWKNTSFQGYADHMLTPQFEWGLQTLIERANQERVALMCAEAVPWRCHRSLIADALLVRGIPVEHILSEKQTMPHALRPFARVEGTRITYPPAEDTKPDAQRE